MLVSSAQKAEQRTPIRRPFGVCLLDLQVEMNPRWASALARATEVFLYSLRRDRSLPTTMVFSAGSVSVSICEGWSGGGWLGGDWLGGDWFGGDWLGGDWFGGGRFGGDRAGCGFSFTASWLVGVWRVKELLSISSSSERKLSGISISTWSKGFLVSAGGFFLVASGLCSTRGANPCICLVNWRVGGLAFVDGPGGWRAVPEPSGLRTGLMAW